MVKARPQVSVTDKVRVRFRVGSGLSSGEV